MPINDFPGNECLLVPNEGLNGFRKTVCLLHSHLGPCPQTLASHTTQRFRPPRVSHRDMHKAFGVLRGPPLLSDLPLSPIHLPSPDAFTLFLNPSPPRSLPPVCPGPPAVSPQPQASTPEWGVLRPMAPPPSSLGARAGFTPRLLSSCENRSNQGSLPGAPTAWLTPLFGAPPPPHNPQDMLPLSVSFWDPDCGQPSAASGTGRTGCGRKGWAQGGT